MSKIKATEQAVCPECGEIDLEYGDIKLESESLSYPFTCPECNHKGHEVYSIEFSCMTREDGSKYLDEDEIKQPN